MSPKELKSLMARTRTSSPMLAEALGIAPQQIRKWRAGTRPVPERHTSAMRLFFRDRAASFGVEPRTLPEIPERVNPREILPTATNTASQSRRETNRCHRRERLRSLRQSTALSPCWRRDGVPIPCLDLPLLRPLGRSR
jgi:hypothetical protein